jgi:hypothetical protein
MLENDDFNGKTSFADEFHAIFFLLQQLTKSEV